MKERICFITSAVILFVIILLVKLTEGSVYTLTPTMDWQGRLKSLKAGDIVFMDPTSGVFSTTSRLGITLAGTLTNPIVITTPVGATKRAQINRPNANQNIIDVESGSFFVIANLELTGGSLGLRLGVSGAVSNAVIHNVSIHDTPETALSCNQNDCTNITVEYCEMYNTGSNTGECMYFGTQGGSHVTSKSRFLFNYCHDTMSATAGSKGSGIQLKTGSNNNLIYGNVCSKTGGPVCFPLSLSPFLSPFLSSLPFLI